MKTKKVFYRRKTDEYAATFGVCSRTVKRWKKESAPLDDPARMRLFVACHKHPPRSFLCA